MKNKVLYTLLLAALAIMALPCLASADEPCTGDAPCQFGYPVAWGAWSFYPSWAFVPVADDYGIFKKHGHRHGVCLRLRPRMEYTASLTSLVVGEDIDWVVAATQDVFMRAFNSGVPLVFLLPQDYSDDNDKVIAFGYDSMKEIVEAGAPIMLAGKSISEHVACSAAEAEGLDPLKLKFVEGLEAQIVAAAQAAVQKGQKFACTAYKPFTDQIEAIPGAKVIYGSHQMPGLIHDGPAIREDRADDNVCRAITAAFLEIQGIARDPGSPQGRQARADAGAFMEASPAEFEDMLSTTHMYWTPQEALERIESRQIRTDQLAVRDYLFKKGFFNRRVKNAGDYGIRWANGDVTGNPKRVMVSFPSRWVREIVEGKVSIK